MQLLNSMSGASPETRLVLLTWAFCLGTDFQSMTRGDLAAALGVSTRHLGVALEYLVREGYLWKIKSPFKRSVGEERKVRFDYGLTPAAWLMGRDWVSAECMWKDEINYVLCLPQSVDETASEKFAAITTQMRLVWIALLLSSNEAGYVVGLDSLALSKMLGMTNEQFRRAVQALSRKGIVSVAANQLARTTLFGPMYPIYKLHPQSTKSKVIMLGVALGDMQLDPMRFLSDLTNYYRRAAKGYGKRKLPIQGSYLLDEQYFELAKYFRNPRLQALVYHACMSIILSVTPSYIANLKTSDSPKEVHQDSPEQATQVNQTRGCEEAALSELVKSILVHGVFCQDLMSFAKASDETGEDKLTNVDEVDILRQFTLSELTREVVNLIQQLSQQWRFFVDCIGGAVRLLDHQRHYCMRTVLPRQNNLVEEKLETDPRDQEYDKLVSCVFEVLVPNTKEYGDCMIVGDELFTANSSVTYSKTRKVDRLICWKKGETPQIS